MSLLFFFCLKIENILDVLNPKHDHLAYQTWENGKLEEMSNGKDGAGEGGGEITIKNSDHSYDVVSKI